MLKKKSSKVVQINDIIQWYESEEIQLSPKYQRNSVWNDKAKSYLIDTIIRGLPIPPIFMRQTIDVATRKTFREIIDGQQRLRAIIEFIQNKFAISKSHNSEYGGKKYEDLLEDIKEQILEYEIFAEVINEKDDTTIYDMFARLNTNNYVLNRQELRNSKYWGEFKVCAYNNAAEYRELLFDNKILNDKQFSRMEDVELISILFNIIISGIETDTPITIDKLYQKYDMYFNEYEEIKIKFDKVMEVIKKIYDYLNGNVKCFTSKVYIYTIFAVIFHQLYGINELEIKRLEKYNVDNIDTNIQEFIDSVISFENEFERCVKNEDKTSEYFNQFVKFDKNHRSRTTNKNERLERITLLNNFLVGAVYGE
ncbi:MAG TPA: DUF262 domain-containing protein [Clostridiales bacterium]|nr:MAG: hypothetical protein A2Y18_03635 [Clostridiales bacterium GWD2_32_19]HCC07779.1 DUF262 domain-containing protein [Clostridiales bacterium]